MCVFNKNREESIKIGFIFSGHKENEIVLNHGKPANIDFYSFANKLTSILGDFNLKEIEEINNKFITTEISCNYCI